MSSHPHVEVMVHRCAQFAIELENSHFPDAGGGTATRTVSPVMSFPGCGWFIKLMDGSEIPVNFCPYCSLDLRDG